MPTPTGHRNQCRQLRGNRRLPRTIIPSTAQGITELLLQSHKTPRTPPPPISPALPSHVHQGTIPRSFRAVHCLPIAAKHLSLCDSEINSAIVTSGYSLASLVQGQLQSIPDGSMPRPTTKTHRERAWINTVPTHPYSQKAKKNNFETAEATPALSWVY